MTGPLSDIPTPIPVEVAAVAAPIPVVVAGGPPPSQASVDREILKSAGQRRVNIIWEVTQSVVACAITGAVIWNATHGQNNDVLNNAFFLIVSMYFVRTNHQLIGGVGTPNADYDYRGR